MPQTSSTLRQDPLRWRPVDAAVSRTVGTQVAKAIRTGWSICRTCATAKPNALPPDAYAADGTC